MVKICEYLNKFQTETWNRIAFTRNVCLNNIRETTLTENLVFNLFMIGQIHSNVIIFEAQNETTNGNDLEIIIKKNGLVVCYLPTQAKIISSTGKYSTISHKVNNVYQIDSLIHYAITNGGVPLYLFYNFDFLSPNLHRYGAALVNANYIKRIFYPTMPKVRWKIPTFNDLCPRYAMPLSKLCQIDVQIDNTEFEIFRELTEIPTSNIDYRNWRRIISVNDFGQNTDLENANDLDYNFNPKFRIEIRINNDNT